MNSGDFKEEIILKPYLKNLYQTVLIGLKRKKKWALLKAINNRLNHLYGEIHRKKRVIIFLYLKK